MEISKAKLAVDAQAELDHPLLDYRTSESRAKTEWMVKHISPYVEAGRKLLDVGCSSGKHTFRAAELGLKATGIDCSEGMLARARDLATESEMNIDLVSGDYTKMPFEDDSFDYALFPKNIVECDYSEYQALVDELSRVLDREGLLFLTMVDWVDRIAGAGTGTSSNYNRMTGIYESTITIPGKGIFDYPTTFWTIGFARFITEQRFDLVDSRVLDSRPTILLVFRLKQGQ